MTRARGTNSLASFQRARAAARLLQVQNELNDPELSPQVESRLRRQAKELEKLIAWLDSKPIPNR